MSRSGRAAAPGSESMIHRTDPPAAPTTARSLPLQGSARAEVMKARRPRKALPVLSSTASRVREGKLSNESRPVDRATRPIHVVWELTLACDLACRHCGSRAGRARPDELNLKQNLDLVGQLAALGVREVTLIGGEVYLYADWTEVVAEIRRSGMDCAIVTGARGMTAEVAQAARDAGVQSVSVSIDGVEATHDRLRGAAGSHRAALLGLEALRAVGMPVAINSQINRLSLGDLDAIMDLVERVDAHGWQLQLTVPAGRAADEPEVLLQPYDLLELFPVLSRLKTRCDALDVKFLPGNNIGYFGPFENQLRATLRCPSDTSCSAGRQVMGIEANGDIKGCPSLPTHSWVGGNIRDHKLVDIWEKSTQLRHTRDRTTDEMWGFCRTCYYAQECRAGCTWMTTSLLGRPGNNPYCHHRALEHEARGLRERVVQVTQPWGEPFDYGRWEIIVEPIDAESPRSLQSQEPGEETAP